MAGANPVPPATSAELRSALGFECSGATHRLQLSLLHTALLAHVR